MKRGATREEIIRTTQEFIARNGIRAVRVDEIAQTLGISKRTLYEMFADKNDLIGACLDAMQTQQQERIVACRKRRSGNPLQKTVRLMNEYIENLYRVDHSFLSDLRRKVVFAEHYDEQREFWHKELALHLDTCRKQELLLPEIDATAFADQLMGALLDLRLNGASQEEVSLFCRTILRGAATRQGIEMIDRRA
ncbi:TetR/AcrR family transcriptional regulator [uncultured Alistipes sp.]|uniref:TetR/AcrR family transcriptional regulator n=1 Tax=uncultured Alistipes sp. TaxID=538949 RepID=UPI00320A0013